MIPDLESAIAEELREAIRKDPKSGCHWENCGLAMPTHYSEEEDELLLTDDDYVVRLETGHIVWHSTSLSTDEHGQLDGKGWDAIYEIYSPPAYWDEDDKEVHIVQDGKTYKAKPDATVEVWYDGTYYGIDGERLPHAVVLAINEALGGLADKGWYMNGDGVEVSDAKPFATVTAEPDDDETARIVVTAEADADADDYYNQEVTVTYRLERDDCEPEEYDDLDDALAAYSGEDEDGGAA